MKIAAFTDVHGAAQVVTDILRRIEAVDVAVVAGDITTGGTPQEAEEAIAIWRPFVPALFAVAGNMDSVAIDQALERLGVSLNGCARRVGEVAFFGASASPEFDDGTRAVSESALSARLQRGFAQAQGAAQLVLVSHTPPFGVVDENWVGSHSGSRAVREFVERVQPALVLCGHIHEGRGQARLGRALVVNCGPAKRGHYALVELDEQGCRAELF